ncbi:transcriptional regulator with XRE-family HTH domain [Paenibacillus mucilaginosus]|uniref:helix-turn-helix transcriptional regulator n=1 Tax=Paenibacillus mucilaginosus TaxID=61624 RepID=UPI003D19B281
MNRLEQKKFDRRTELAEFLRSRRERLSPEQAGLPPGGRRRTPGLRRTEVALLAGVSVEWYTWLEQGREISVSAALLESLCRTLQLDAAERRHLFLLAHRQPPPADPPAGRSIPPALQPFLDGLGLTPGCVLDARMTVVAWNKAFCAVFGDYDAWDEQERNLIRMTFTSPYLRQLKGEEWEAQALRLLAQFRAGYGRFVEDPWWAETLQELSRISPEFREMWSRHEVIETPEGRKHIRHPSAGLLTFEPLALQVIDSPDLQLLVNTPVPGSGTAEKIERLLADSSQATITE